MASIRDDDSEFERDLALLQRAGALLDQAMGLPPGDREAFVRKQAGEDSALRDAALALVREGSAERSETDAPAGARTRATSPGSRVEADLQRGDRVGPFVVLDTIGHGGMGSVYLAEQKEPVRRRVALKVIKLGMDTKAVLARFEAERQALAMMDHSHIAKVLEAGVTANGKPYFAMEYVKGMPITRYCDDNKLSLEDRLALFRQVCSGVQHAHTKGVIHRDLTPNNVLVTLQDGKPAAKIIDFGLARATDHRLTEKTLFTEQGVILGTPEYMSPEQAGLNALDIDMRSDVYTLGVLLYELIAGKPPFEGKELRAQGYDRMCQKIREDAPPRPSTKVTTMAGGVDTAAKLRRTDGRTLLRRLRGDLDWIALRCLEKDRMRRYETVSHLADDVVRYLESEPVLARAPSTRYRMARFARRYRREVRVVAIGCAVSLVGMGVVLHYQRVAEHARARSALDQHVASKSARESLAAAIELDGAFGIVEVSAGMESVRMGFRALAVPWNDVTEARRWLVDVDEILAKRAKVQGALSKIDEPSAATWVPLAGGEIIKDVPEGSLQMSKATRRVRSGLIRLLAELDDLKENDRIALEQRLRCAELTTRHPRARVTWESAAKAVRAADGRVASELYREQPIDLRPHIGLVPIGMNPVTKLWEFYELRSAWNVGDVADPAQIEIPVHGPDGKIQVDAGTGIVFVLLPAGGFMMGAQSTSEDGPNYDSLAQAEEGPPHYVRLSSLFLARHEMTEGQYRRLARIDIGSSLKSDDRFPRADISWGECTTRLGVNGMLLPSEAEWEYGCRAGTTSPWWIGNTAESVADEVGGVARPVGSMPSNAFGLFDTVGSLMEWCRDEIDSGDLASTYSDRGNVANPCGAAGSHRLVRGGCAIGPALLARSASRRAYKPGYHGLNIGFRPAIALRF